MQSGSTFVECTYARRPLEGAHVSDDHVRRPAVRDRICDAYDNLCQRDCHVGVLFVFVPFQLVQLLVQLFIAELVVVVVGLEQL